MINKINYPKYEGKSVPFLKFYPEYQNLGFYTIIDNITRRWNKEKTLNYDEANNIFILLILESYLQNDFKNVIDVTSLYLFEIMKKINKVVYLNGKYEFLISEWDKNHKKKYIIKSYEALNLKELLNLIISDKTINKPTELTEELEIFDRHDYLIEDLKIISSFSRDLIWELNHCKINNLKGNICYNFLESNSYLYLDKSVECLQNKKAVYIIKDANAVIINCDSDYKLKLVILNPSKYKNYINYNNHSSLLELQSQLNNGTLKIEKYDVWNDIESKNSRLEE